MPTRSPSPLSNRSGAFTLLELLVVIAIIAVLASILMSVIGKVQNSARKVAVMNDIRNIRISITNFRQENNNRLPINDTQQSALDYEGDDTVYGDPGGLYKNVDLFNILRAVPDTRFNEANHLNPNKVVYWEGQPATNIARPTNGITQQDYTDPQTGAKVEAGSFVDSWGHPYVVWIDANRDDDLSTAAAWFYHDVKAGTVKVLGQHLGVEFGSLGPDGQFGTKGNGVLQGSDDVVTWQ